MVRWMSAVFLGTLLPPLSAAAAEPPRFTGGPAVRRTDEGLLVEFAVSRFTDVAVAVENEAGEVVRHLAAGMLGANAPAPLEPRSLAQRLAWDRTDDAGKPVPKGRYRVRVSLGLSARFERLIGYDPRWLGNVHALAVGPKGNLYVYCSRGVVVLDRRGRYLRQIVPAPADLPADKLAGLQPVRLADGTLYFQRPYALPGRFVGSMAVSSRGELLLPGPARYSRNLTRIGLDGLVPADAFDIRLTKFSDVGFLYLAASPDGRLVYISGAEAGYKGDDARKVSYRQVVYRLDLRSKGPAEIFTGDDENAGGPGFSVNRPKGLATDPEGRLYLCNHRGDNIAVYTPGAGLLRAIPVKRPQQVAVHPGTGRLYVLAGAEKGYTKYGYDYPATMTEARLLRLSPQGEVELETKLPHPYVRRGRTRPGPSYRLSMAVDFTGERPVVWVGTAYPGAEWSRWRLLRIEDRGDTFGPPREISPIPPVGLIVPPMQLALDRKRDILYINHGSFTLDRFTGDGKRLPSLTLRHPKTRQKYYVAEFALSPDGTINVLGWGGRYGYRNNFIARFSPEGKLLAWPGEKEPGTETRGSIRRTMKGAGGSSCRGFAVGPDGRFYVMYYDLDKSARKGLPPWDAAFRMRVAVARFAPDGTLEDPRLVAHLRAGAQGIRIDSRGNIYVGDNFMPVGVTYPVDFVGLLPDPLKRVRPAMLEDGSFDPLLRWMGSLFKFGPAGGRIVGLPEGTRARPFKPTSGDLFKPVPAVQWFLHNNHKLKVTGAEWQFHGLSPVPAQYQGVTHVERCVCRGGRFDIDPFDRIFLPDQLRHRITVLDSAGNVITRFGTYGNQDSAGPEIGLADPWWVAAAADRCYVGDGSALRIVKVRLTYAAEKAAPVPD